MRILTAPARLTLNTASPARMTIILHNDGDEDRVCFPTLEGLDANAFEVTFEPSLGFIEARCAAKFEVHVEARPATSRQARLERALWTIYVDGRVADRAPVEIKLEPYRSLTARISEDDRPRLVLFNEGVVDESIHIDTVLAAHATPAMVREWTLGPGSWVSVPLEFEQAGLQPVTLCITGGPRPIVIEARAVQHPRAAASHRRVRRVGHWRRAALAAGAVAASLLVGFPLERATQAPRAMLAQATRPTFVQASMLGEAMPFVALGYSHQAMRTSEGERRLAARLVAFVRPLLPVHSGTVQRVHSGTVLHAWRRRAAVLNFAVRRVPVAQPKRRAPDVTKFDTPAEVAPGSRVAIRFGSAYARSVRIVAKIGPTVVRTFDVAGGNGRVSLQAPQGRKTSRLMTVRIYALGSGTATATREAFVSILPG